MKLIKFFPVVLFLFMVANLQAQEEFLDEENGLSLGLASGVETSFGLSFKSHDGFLVSAHMTEGDGYSLYGATLGSYFIKASSFNALVAVSYSVLKAPGTASDFYASNVKKHIGGLHLGFMQKFLCNTSFPMSIGLNASGVYLEYPVISAGASFTQAFFAKSRVYPLVGVHYNHPLNAEYYGNTEGAFNLFFGFNIRI